MSHGADDPAGHDQGMGSMVPPVPGTNPGEANGEAQHHNGHGADDTNPEAGGEQHGGRVGGGGGVDDPADTADDNGAV